MGWVLDFSKFENLGASIIKNITLALRSLYVIVQNGSKFNLLYILQALHRVTPQSSGSKGEDTRKEREDGRIKKWTVKIKQQN